MKRIVSVLAVMLVAMTVQAQIQTAFTKVGTTTVYFAAVTLGATSNYDLAFANRSTGTDTLMVAFNVADTTAARVNAGACLYVYANEIHNVTGLRARASIWIKGSSTVAYSITGVQR